MSEITLKNGKAITPKGKRRKKKNHLKRFFITLGVIVILLPLIFIAIIFALFYDEGHKDIKVRDNYPITEIFSDIVTHSLDETTSSKNIRLRITEDQINQLFYDALYEVGGKIKIVDNMYIEIKNNRYVFVTELNLYNFFKTRLFITTKLTANDDKIEFKIDDLQLGRMTGLDNVARFILKHVSLPDINKKIHEAGFNMNVDIANLVINYPMDKLYDDLFKMVNTGASEFATLLKAVMTLNEISTFIPYSDRALEFDIDLQKMTPTSALHHIDNYVMPNGYLDTLLVNSMDKVKNYLENGIISEEHSTVVGKYYVIGFDYLSPSEQEIITNYLSNSAFTPATGTYTYEIPTSENLHVIALNELNSQIASHANPIVLSLNTDQIDRALSQARAIGNIFVLTSKDEENHYTANYIGIDRVTSFTDTTDNSLYIGLSVNFNGYDTMISLKTKKDDDYTAFAKTRFLVENMYVGDHQVSEECKNAFVELISNSIGEAAFDNVISFEPIAGNLYLNVDLSELLISHGITEAMGYNVGFDLGTQTATNPGALMLWAEHS